MKRQEKRCGIFSVFSFGGPGELHSLVSPGLAYLGHLPELADSVHSRRLASRPPGASAPSLDASSDAEVIKKMALAPRASRSLGAALRSRTLQSALVCLFYAASSLTLSVVNKAVLTSYDFHCYFLLLAVQLAVALVFCSVSRMLGNPFSIPSIRSWAHLAAAVPMATCFVLNVAVGCVGGGGWGGLRRVGASESLAPPLARKQLVLPLPPPPSTSGSSPCA